MDHGPAEGGASASPEPASSPSSGTRRAPASDRPASARPASARPASARPASARPAPTPSDPEWYRDAIIYEVHVRAFRDSNGDGIGDFRGLIDKLDYLCDLGVTALWLLPFYPSPLRDDGYDIADYVSVNPAYGTLRDAETLIREAHNRGLRVITELVCNHTSDQHPWFQRARRAKPGSPTRDFYVWSDTPDRYSDARIIFKDFETSNWTWDPVAGAYYWHRFYSHQPDLNFDNPRVRRAVTKAMDFWLDRGVDGLRLDAVPYLFERDGTDCENLPETHAFLRELRHHIDERYADRMLLGEANQWPEDSAAYFGDGDECQMAFNFPVMPRMFMAIQMEDRLPIVDIIEQTPALPSGAQWALFLRNHDELTLEMVTDEERDYMYRAYARDPRARVNLGIRRRLAPLLGNHRRRLELMNGLLFSLPGTPVIYYGDEIGMGDNVYLGDRDSVRTPMQWSGDRNAGFSNANREQLYLPVVTDPENNFEAVNVAVQQANPYSLLWWMKRLIALRKRHPAFGRGDLVLLHPENRHVLAFLRSLGDETILVVANLSRFFQPVELDLAGYEGRQPVEMFGRIEFPIVSRAPYALSLGPHDFLWFTLDRVPGRSDGSGQQILLPAVSAASIGDLLDGTSDGALATALLAWIKDRSWYRGRGRPVNHGEIIDRFEVATGKMAGVIVILQVSYSEGGPETYLVPLTTGTAVDGSFHFAGGSLVSAEGSGLRIAALGTGEAEPSAGYLVDAAQDPAFAPGLIAAIAGRRHMRGLAGELVGRPESVLAGSRARDLGASTGKYELQMRHVLELGPDPEAETIQFLTAQGASWIPKMVGRLEYLSGATSPICVAYVREALGGEGDADMEGVARHSLLDFLEKATAAVTPSTPVTLTTADLVRASCEEPPDSDRDMFGSFLDLARSMGRRVGEFHTILATQPSDPTFAPEPLTRLYQRSLYQSIDAVSSRAFRQVAGRLGSLEGVAVTDAALLLSLRGELKDRLRLLVAKRYGGSRIRIHGSLHLGNLRQAERGTVVMDLVGDTDRTAGERRLKRSPLRDVASMIASFHDLALGRLRSADLGGSLRAEDAAAVDLWAGRWFLGVAAGFLAGYREATEATDCLPAADDEWIALLDAFRIQEALDDLTLDLRNEPARVPSSIRGLLELLGR
jgi:maltose alpha-D-glucosyltransferase/alpha-amylase